MFCTFFLVKKNRKYLNCIEFYCFTVIPFRFFCVKTGSTTKDAFLRFLLK